jgi:hypothetical protein
LNKKKILITGFPNSGTSILKSKMSEVHNAYTVPYEQFFLNQGNIQAAGEFEYIIYKVANLPLEMRVEGIQYSTQDPKGTYYGHSVIFVIRNPYNTFTKIITAGYNPLEHIEWHLDPRYYWSLPQWFAAAKFWLDAKNGNYPNIYAIRYEDYFDNDGKAIKDIMDGIGLKYDDDIFQKRTKDYVHHPGVEYKNINVPIPKSLDHGGILRTWQINQPFQNMNSEVNIPDELANILKNSNIIQELGYSDPRITG